MSKCDVYDATVKLRVRRGGEEKTVPFNELKDGDIVLNADGNASFTCDGDAHMSGDSTYGGWLVYSRGSQNTFFPEDFGAKRIV